MDAYPRLDPQESHAWVDAPGGALFLRHMPPNRGTPDPRIVLYVHGGTFPSGLSVAWRLDGRSWRDSLCDRGFHVWGLDFRGFGHSSRYPEPTHAEPVGRLAEASEQLEAAVRCILQRHGACRLSLIAHSWGSMVAGDLAGRCPDLVDRMVFFGPISRRPGAGPAIRLPPLRLISLQDQWDRFTADVPHGEAPVLSHQHFAAWGQAYLDTDPLSRTRLASGDVVEIGSMPVPGLVRRVA